ncbi:MAG: ABC transporter substrate-binding protein [Chloroflexota bacterium]|nr:peptide ABC transporter substrate-binding protein [Caldilinea sp.]GIK74913.1 MAG: ABC transporter substrate-binding protein [Chloroflexota bacterium]
MKHSGNRRTFLLIGLLAAIALVFAACAAPAAAPSTGAEQPAAGAAAGLPAEPGRGTDGTVTLVYWQEISILNPYLASGTKDFHAASLILEPLLEFNQDSELVPALAVEVPTLENGGVSEDLMSITYKLKDGIVWADGTPLTADDFVFTWEYCTAPLTGCTVQNFVAVANVEAVDPQTVKITFRAPAPYPYIPFVGYLSPVLQKAQFENCVGEAAQACSDQNTNPIGTGPYKVKEFRANDTVVYEINENYRHPDKPHFAEVVIKGAEDASSSARAVLETGEADYGWNLQVEPAVLLDMEAKGLGTLMASFGGNVERILINFTNPDPALGDKRSVWSPDDPNPHPFLTDIAVRKALSLAIDRNIIAEQLYGPAGKPTCNLLAGPPAVASTNNDACLTQDIAAANALLDEAGYVDSNGDGVRETPDGQPLKILYQTSTNSVRQKTQALIQQWWKEIGIETELKNVEAAVFFGGDPASPDTLNKFYTDVQMFTNGPDNPDPQQYLSNWLCQVEGEYVIQTPANNWGGSNVERWCSPEYDALYETLKSATGEERAQIAIQLNDMIVQNYVAIPLVFRASVSAHANSLIGPAIGGFESEEWNIEDWHRAR